MAWLDVPKNHREYLIEGSIVEINEVMEEMVIEGPLTIIKSLNKPEREGEKLEPNKYPIKVGGIKLPRVSEF